MYKIGDRIIVQIPIHRVGRLSNGNSSSATNWFGLEKAKYNGCSGVILSDDWIYDEAACYRVQLDAFGTKDFPLHGIDMIRECAIDIYEIY